VTRLDDAALDAFTDDFRVDALRYEILPAYDVASDRGELARYLAGEAGPEPETVAPWGRWVRAQLDRGAAVRRLRVVQGPLSDYLRFECEWVYTANVAAGEDIRILDLTDHDAPDGLPLSELWVLDHARAAVMDYDDAGWFLHADTVDPHGVRELRDALAAAWDAAEPFTTWWASHPEYHRADDHHGDV